MEDLTFGEQVKIILGRKGMTIKELAEIIEERTGKKMSRQNLTQRLGRDNFQEQDMRMIANILECPFQLSILSRETPVTYEGAHAARTEPEQEKKTAEQKQTQAGQHHQGGAVQEDVNTEAIINETAQESAAQEPIVNEENDKEVDMTIGELYEIHEELAELEETVEAGEPVEVIREESKETGEKIKEKKEKFLTGGIFLRKKGQSAQEKKRPSNESEKLPRENVQEADAVHTDEADEKKETVTGHEDFEPVIKHDDAEENLNVGEVNPYTGREFQSNSVRMHPSRIGYVQVYDRSTHKWTDMTEWAFLGYQERKKALLGKDYEPPIYLD